MSESQLHPVGGVDYPRTIQEFERWFPSEEACAAYLQRLRWPEGFRCPACGAGHAWMTARGLFRCAACQRQSSPIAGTIFEGTRKPLRAWFEAMWFVTNQKSGGSALGLQRILGLGSGMVSRPAGQSVTRRDLFREFSQEKFGYFLELHPAIVAFRNAGTMG